MDDETAAGTDNIVAEFNTYEEFLDSQITSFDLYYLEVTVRLFKYQCFTSSHYCLITTITAFSLPMKYIFLLKKPPLFGPFVVGDFYLKP